MAKIIGNTTATPNPRPDWNQTDETKADYIKNKPIIPSIEGLATEEYVEKKVSSIDLSDSVLKTDIDQVYSSESENAQSGKAVAEAIANMVDSAPETLNTLNELAAALGDDPNFATTVATQIGQKADKADIVQSDWNQTDNTQVDYIKNKPIIPSVDGLATKEYVDNAISHKNVKVDPTIAKRINNLENAISPLLVIDKVDDTVAQFKIVPDNVLPYAYINKLEGDCNIFNFGANILDFENTFSTSLPDVNSSRGIYLTSEGRVKLSYCDRVSSNTSESIRISATGLTTDTFVYPPGMYSSYRNVAIPSGNDDSAKIKTYFVAHTLGSNNDINIEEGTFIEEFFIIKEFVIKLDFYVSSSVRLIFDVVLDTNLSIGEKVRDYTPYKPPVSFSIPSEIKAIEGYGITGNYIDFERKVFVRKTVGDEVDVSVYLSEDNMIQVESGGILLFQPSEWTKPGINTVILTQIMSGESKWDAIPSTIVYKKEIFAHGLTSIGESWEDVQSIVRCGLGKFVFPVGYEFTMKDNKTGNNLVWVVRDHDNHKAANPNLNHTMTLELKDAFSETSGLCQKMSFNPRNALYYAKDGLGAGEYSFTVAKSDFNSANVGQWFFFHLNNPVPEEGRLVVSLHTPTSNIEDGTLETYSKDGALYEATKIYKKSAPVGTSLGSTGSNQLNDMDRAISGSNNYAQSTIRQWLNCSTEYFKDSWKPQTIYDVKPFPTSWIDTVYGFMAHLPEDFLNIVSVAEIPCITNNVYEVPSDDCSGELLTQYKLQDKFFLLSMPEIYGGYQEDGSINDGTPVEFYTNLSHSERIKYDVAGIARRTLQRTPCVHTSYMSYDINNTDGIAYGVWSNNIGLSVTPACIIA